MSRVINADSPGAQRQRIRRTIAEALRHLMQKQSLDDETKDLAALIYYSLRELSEGIDRSAAAWEKRNYFVKADRFRRDWEWIDGATEEMSTLIIAEQWVRLPVVLARLVPRFSDINIKQNTRSPDVWRNRYQQMLEKELSLS